MESCVYHHKRWRGQIQKLLNDLRGKLLSSQHIRLFPRAVCTCKGLPASVHTTSLSELQQWVKESASDEFLDKAHPSLIVVLKEAQSNLSPFSDSMIRVLSTVKSATEGDFIALTPPLLTTTKNGTPLPPTVTFDLDIPCTFLGDYFGSSGSQIKPLCHEYDVSIHIGTAGTKSKRKSKLTGEKFEVKVEGKPGVQTDFSAIKERLIAKAKLVQEEKELLRKNVSSFSRFRAAYRAAHSGGRQGVTSAATIATAKEAAVEHFEKKRQHGKSNRSTAVKKPCMSVLSDGHCLNCMSVYQAGCTEDGACCYHHGFLVPLKVPDGINKTSWSCCGLATTEQHSSHDLHLNTGCFTARHVWRPGKGSSRGSTKDQGGVSKADFSVQ